MRPGLYGYVFGFLQLDSRGFSGLQRGYLDSRYRQLLWDGFVRRFPFSRKSRFGKPRTNKSVIMVSMARCAPSMHKTRNTCAEKAICPTNSRHPSCALSRRSNPPTAPAERAKTAASTRFRSLSRWCWSRLSQNVGPSAFCITSMIILRPSGMLARSTRKPLALFLTGSSHLLFPFSPRNMQASSTSYPALPLPPRNSPTYPGNSRRMARPGNLSRRSGHRRSTNPRSR